MVGRTAEKGSSDCVLERLSFQKFHRDERMAILFADVVDRADVRMIECGSSTGFPAKTFEGLGILSDIIREELEGDEPAQFGVLSLVDDTHSAAKLVLRKTIRQRLSAKLRELKEELRRRWHLPVPDLGKWLRSIVQGYFNYHAVPGNLVSLRSFRLQVIRRWFRALRRRSQRSRMTWPRIEALANRWLQLFKNVVVRDRAADEGLGICHEAGILGRGCR